MSFLDTVANTFSRAGAGSNTGALTQQLGTMLASGGGLNGLVQMFEQAGLGHVIQSWIGTGQNLPISPDQLQQVLGNGKVAEIAQALGVQPAQATTQLSQVLPHLVDHLTPDGAMPTSALGHADISGALTSIFSRLGAH